MPLAGATGAGRQQLPTTAEVKRGAVLAFVTSFWQENGYGPSIREIVEGTGLSSTSMVAFHVNALIAQGKLLKEPNIARTLRPA